MAKRWVVTGSGGQLGQCLVQGLEADTGSELVAAFGHGQLDISDRASVDALFDKLPGGAPDVLVNAAAYTKVDRCEQERELAFQVNGDAPGFLAELCRREGVQLVHVSTDYVFNGRSSEPYPVDAPTDPQSVYGASKLAGEKRVLAVSPDFVVVRTAWVFGPGRNFVKAILNQGRLRRSGEVSGPLRVVDDQHGCPTYSDDLAAGLRALVAAGARGLYHLSNADPTTWWGFARAILDLNGYGDLEIEPSATVDLDLEAPRPEFSVLDCSRAAELGVRLRPWREALEAYLESPDGQAARKGS